MPNCPKCEKPVYFAERKFSLGKDWHAACLRCGRCNKTLTTGQHSEHEGLAYCSKPCYAVLFGPTGYGRGGVAESFVYSNPPAGTAPVPQQAQPLPQTTN